MHSAKDLLMLMPGQLKKIALKLDLLSMPVRHKKAFPCTGILQNLRREHRPDADGGRLMFSRPLMTGTHPGIFQQVPRGAAVPAGLIRRGNDACEEDIRQIWLIGCAEMTQRAQRGLCALPNSRISLLTVQQRLDGGPLPPC